MQLPYGFSIFHRENFEGTCVSVWALAKAVEGHELELAKEKACGNDGVELFI